MNFVHSHLKHFAVIFTITIVALSVLLIVGNYGEAMIVDPVLYQKLGYVFAVISFICVVILAYTAAPLLITLVIKASEAMPVQSEFLGMARLHNYVISHKYSIIAYYTYGCWLIFTVGIALVFIIQGNILSKP